ncbi:MAG: hypothetical protein JWM36_1580 [Hyphomicrobiales bacterium]|nr:hypothetical protein [Hyphomicrobiales bacterium]
MLWILLAAAVGGAIIGGLYMRAVVIVMTSAQLALFLFAQFLSTPLTPFDLVFTLLASLAVHQVAYFLMFTLRLFVSGDINVDGAPMSPADRETLRGVSPALGERFDEVIVLAGEIERRAPQVRREAAHVSRLIREIRLSLEERRARAVR